MSFCTFAYMQVKTLNITVMTARPSVSLSVRLTFRLFVLLDHGADLNQI